MTWIRLNTCTAEASNKSNLKLLDIMVIVGIEVDMISTNLQFEIFDFKSILDSAKWIFLVITNLWLLGIYMQ